MTGETQKGLDATTVWRQIVELAEKLAEQVRGGQQPSAGEIRELETLIQIIRNLALLGSERAP